MPPKSVKQGSHLETSVTSSLNEHFICDACGRKFESKKGLSQHIKIKCARGRKARILSTEFWKKWRETLSCKTCGIVYGNKTLLARHIENLHSEGSKTSEGKSNVKEEHVMAQIRKCSACNRMFQDIKALRCHRRKKHFNLLAKIPYCNQKKVNQVWFEKVMNCNNIVEIHKTAPNTLVLRKLDEKTAIKVFESDPKLIDLSDLYPTS